MECPTCRGKGKIPNRENEYPVQCRVCPTCDGDKKIVFCPKCECPYPKNTPFRFCPNCGASMEVK